MREEQTTGTTANQPEAKQQTNAERPGALGGLVRLVQRLLEINGHHYGGKKSF